MSQAKIYHLYLYLYLYEYTDIHSVGIFRVSNYLLKSSEKSEANAVSKSWRKRIEIFLYKEIGKDCKRFTQQ